MANKLRETIFLICQEVDPNLGISADKATEAILQAVRDYCKCDCDDKN